MRKEDAPCCVALKDDLGRLPIGFCSPEGRKTPDAPAARPHFVAAHRGSW